MIEAPVQITDEYVRKYLWEHNLVAVDEGDLRRMMQPKKLLTVPALMEQAGWVRKKEWQGLTNEEIMDACSAVWASHPVEVGQVVQNLLKERNT